MDNCDIALAVGLAVGSLFGWLFAGIPRWDAAHRQWQPDPSLVLHPDTATVTFRRMVGLEEYFAQVDEWLIDGWS